MGMEQAPILWGVTVGDSVHVKNDTQDFKGVVELVEPASPALIFVKPEGAAKAEAVYTQRDITKL